MTATPRRITLKQNDTLPPLDATLGETDAAGTFTPHDLTGATVRFKMRYAGQTTVKVEAAAALVVPASGTVRYSWAVGDLDTANEFESEFQVTFPGGGVRTYPNDGYLKILVKDDVDVP